MCVSQVALEGKWQRDGMMDPCELTCLSWVSQNPPCVDLLMSWKLTGDISKR